MADKRKWNGFSFEPTNNGVWVQYGPERLQCAFITSGQWDKFTKMIGNNSAGINYDSDGFERPTNG